MSEATRPEADPSPRSGGGRPRDETEWSSEVLDAYWDALERGEAADPKLWLDESTESGGEGELPGMLNMLRLLHRHRGFIPAGGGKSYAGRPAPVDREGDRTHPHEPDPAVIGLPDAAWLAARDLYLLGSLGTGGMAKVFLAWHGGLKSEVILKVARDPAHDMRFRREIEIQTRLGGHPNIALVRTAGEYKGRPCLVVEHVVGVGLHKLVAVRGPLPTREACAYVRQAALGLGHAHDRGIVHRDVKPANLIRSDEDGAVRVIDWGLAKENDKSGQRDELTRPGVMMGSLNYCPPEQIGDAAGATHRSDLYGLGCTFYELLSGRPPFAGHTDLVGAHLFEPAPPLPPDLGVPRAVEKVVRKLLSKRPEDRYASTAEFIAALDAALAAEPGTAPGRRPLGVALAATLLLASALAAAYWLGTVRSSRVRGIGNTSPASGAASAPAAKGRAGSIPAAAATLTNSIGMKLVLVEAGSFLMGATREDLVDSHLEGEALDYCVNLEGPKHRVTLNKPFYMGACEVTQGEHAAVMGVNPSHFAPGGKGAERVRGEDTSRLPVESVSWGDAIKFCNALSHREGLPPYYEIIDLSRGEVRTRGGPGYRLPTEAEWEHACRARTTGPFCFAKADDYLDLVRRLGEHAWHSGNSDSRTHTIGEKRPNGFGMYDMNGNVGEWVWDTYAPDYYRRSPPTDPQGPDLSPRAGFVNRITRSGSFKTDVTWLHNSARSHTGPQFRSERIGFRVVRTPE